MKSRRLLHSRSCRDFFANYTSIGVVNMPAAAVWDLLGDTCSWLTSVTKVEEVANSRTTSGFMGEQTKYNVVQTTKVNLVGKDFHVDMLMNIDSNSFHRSMSFKSLKRNKLMSKMEGSFKVIPLNDRRRILQLLDHVDQGALDRLLSSDRVSGGNKTLVVLEQAVQPSMMPPQFVRGIFKKHLGRSIDSVMADLQNGAAEAQQSKQSNKARPFYVKEETYRALVPAFAALNRFFSMDQPL
jgi:hypothetical protein